jgi:hypothetical protein
VLAQGIDGTSGERVSFSFMSLPTNGFGGLTPHIEVGRWPVVLTSLVGNLRRRGG